MLTPLQKIATLGSGSHSPLPIQMDMLEPMNEYCDEEQPNVTLLPGIAGIV